VDNIKIDLLQIGWRGVEWECSTNGAKRNAYRLLVGEPDRKRPLARPRRSRMDNIKIDLLEIGSGGVEWACSTNRGEEERV
jgi:hypothetical protein